MSLLNGTFQSLQPIVSEMYVRCGQRWIVEIGPLNQSSLCGLLFLLFFFNLSQELISCLAMIAAPWHLPLEAHSKHQLSAVRQGRLSRLLTEQKEFLFPWEAKCCYRGRECSNSCGGDKQAATLCWWVAAGWRWTLGLDLLMGINRMITDHWAQFIYFMYEIPWFCLGFRKFSNCSVPIICLSISGT